VQAYQYLLKLSVAPTKDGRVVVERWNRSDRIHHPFKTPLVECPCVATGVKKSSVKILKLPINNNIHHIFIDRRE